MRTLVMAVAAVLLGASAPVPTAAPAWIVGHWRQCALGGSVSETWVAGDGMVVGLGVTVQPGRPTRFEWMRIAPGPDGRLAFYAQPQGAREETAFPLVEASGQRLVFANPEHDFPQRVIYVREGDVLTGAIEGRVGEREQRLSWTYRPSDVGGSCPAEG